MRTPCFLTALSRGYNGKGALKKAQPCPRAGEQQVQVLKASGTQAAPTSSPAHLRAVQGWARWASACMGLTPHVGRLRTHIHGERAGTSPSG